LEFSFPRWFSRGKSDLVVVQFEGSGEHAFPQQVVAGDEVPSFTDLKVWKEMYSCFKRNWMLLFDSDLDNVLFLIGN
jgi:hypothetical protein